MLSWFNLWEWPDKSEDYNQIREVCRLGYKEGGDITDM